MATVTELTFAEELKPLQDIVAQRPDDWQLGLRGSTEFALGIRDKNKAWIWFLVRCDRYPGAPPAWHWFNPETGAVDQPTETLRTGGFFHSSGVVCAPWNRLAYRAEDPRGPHPEWIIGNWREIPQTGQCNSLAAMALRLYVELHSPRYPDRKEG
jgi:hypothetical protein